MEELISNINLTSLLVVLVSMGYIKFRDSNYEVGDTEKYTTVFIFILSVLSWLVSTLILIWI